MHNIPIKAEILALIAEIDEFKGAWLDWGKLAPDRLTTLRKLPPLKALVLQRELKERRFLIKKWNVF